MKETNTYLLRLPRSLKQAVERLSREVGTSINQFVATAVAEKLSALENSAVLCGPEKAGGFQVFRPYHEATPGSRRGRAMKCKIKPVVISSVLVFCK